MDLQKYIQKKKRKQEAQKEILRLSIDGDVFEFSKLSDDKYAEFQSKIVDLDQAKDSTELIELCRDMIYFSCPDLRTSELQQEFNVSYPPSVVTEIFSGAEISATGAELMKFNGMTETDVVKKL